MFNTSTQKQNWLFKDANQIAELRKKANNDFVKKQNVEVRITLMSLYVYC